MNGHSEDLQLIGRSHMNTYQRAGTDRRKNNHCSNVSLHLKTVTKAIF